MSDDDLFVAVPWLIFATGLIVIGWRLALGRVHAARGKRGAGRTGNPGAPGAPGA
jgi:hypothetical protein